MLRFAAVVFLLLALPVHANLGDTVAACVKRYGKPNNFTEANAKSPFGTIAFVAGPYEMIVFLYNGVEVGARVSKKDKTAFTPDEIKTILNADAPTPWTSAPNDEAGSLQWTRADKATASYDVAAKMIIFTTPEMLQEMNATPPVPAAPSTPAPAPPPHPSGDFAPAAPTQWAAPTAPPTNAPATNAPSTDALPK